MKRVSKYVYFLITLAFFIWIDLHFSDMLAAGTQNGMRSQIDLMNLVYVKNTGAAFSILQSSTEMLIIFSVVAVAFLFYYVIRNLDTILMKEIFCFSLLIAGICGNMYERIHFGYVRDFFELTFVNFPVFNISDIFINVGFFSIIILILLSKKPIKF